MVCVCSVWRAYVYEQMLQLYPDERLQKKLVDGSGMCTVRLHVRRARSLQFEFCLVNFAKKEFCMNRVLSKVYLQN